MGKGSAPTPPSPERVAGAQTAQNIGTAIANTRLGNVNQITPYGNLTYTETGSRQFVDPNQGHIYDIPTYTAETTLPAEQQAALDAQNAATGALSRTAENQANFLEGYMPNRVRPATLPQRGASPKVQAPSRQTNDGGYIRKQGGDERGINWSYAKGGDVQKDIDPVRNLDFDESSGGNIRYGVQNNPAMTTQYAKGGDIQRDIGYARNLDFSDANGGNIRYGVQNNPAMTTQYAKGGDITKTYGNADFAAQRERVEQGIMDRARPEIDRERSALRTRLANQGITQGSEAYKQAMDQFQSGLNDFRLGAIERGGQEQSRLVGLERDRAQFQNQAQGQAFGQQRTNIDRYNDVQNQRFNQGVTRVGLNNQAQQQRFGQEAINRDAFNQAQQQQFSQQQARMQAANQAQSQAFGQQRTNIDRYNDVQNQRFNQGVARVDMNNQAQAQRFDQENTNRLVNNQAQQQQFGQQQAEMQARNAAQQQQFNQQFQNRSQQNSLQNQRFQQQMQNDQFANQAQNQAFNQARTMNNDVNTNNQNLFNQQLAKASYQDARRASGLQEQLALRNQPINEITALLSGGQVNVPQFNVSRPSAIPTTDYAGIVNQNYNQQMANYQQQQMQSQGLLGGLFSLGAGALSGGFF